MTRKPKAPAQEKGRPAAGGEAQPARPPRQPPRPAPLGPGAQAPSNNRSHAQYPDPELPPDRVWEDRAG